MIPEKVDLIDNLNVKDMVKDNKQVYFIYYQKDELWYRHENGFDFPVPITDTGDAIFKNQDKAMFFMRWINKHIKFINESKSLE